VPVFAINLYLGSLGLPKKAYAASTPVAGVSTHILLVLISVPVSLARPYGSLACVIERERLMPLETRDHRLAFRRHSGASSKFIVATLIVTIKHTHVCNVCITHLPHTPAEIGSGRSRITCFSFTSL